MRDLRRRKDWLVNNPRQKDTAFTHAIRPDVAGESGRAGPAVAAARTGNYSAKRRSVGPRLTRGIRLPDNEGRVPWDGSLSLAGSTDSELHILDWPDAGIAGQISDFDVIRTRPLLTLLQHHP